MIFKVGGGGGGLCDNKCVKNFDTIILLCPEPLKSAISSYYI